MKSSLLLYRIVLSLRLLFPALLWQKMLTASRVATLTTAMLTTSLLAQAQIEATRPLFRALGEFNPAPVEDNRNEGLLVSSVHSDQGGEIYFSNPLTIKQATGNDPNTAFPWGDNYKGKAYGNLQSTVTTLTLPGNTKAFYFSVKPLVFDGSVTVSATSYNGYTVSDGISQVTSGKAVQFGFRVTNVMDNIKSITITLNNSITPFIGEFLINQCDPYTFTVDASNGGVLTCSNPTLQLTAPSVGYGYYSPGDPLRIYTFTGPNGFYERKTQDYYDTERYVYASAPGTYTVTIEEQGSCTGTGTVTITEDKKLPTNVTLNTDDGTLTCKKTSVTLTAGSTNGKNYAFTGPKGFSQSGTATTASVTEPGTYFLVVTGSNGCSAGVQTIVVNAEAAPPANVTQSLIDLYNATGGPNWTRKDNWIVSCNPCGWYGVTCDNEGRVTKLNLIGNNLVGTLPASLSVLTSLQSLELGANALSGGIPLGIGNLTALQTLNLSRTKLGGPIPASLGGLTRLQNLLLNESALTGSLPASLGGLTQLQNLQLYTNQLSGCFPASYTALCGRSQISFANNPNLPGGGDFAAFCSNGTGGQLVVSQFPRSGTACAGSAFNFSVTARGATTYQWYKLGPGQGQFQRLAESGPVLRFSSVSMSDAGSYQVYINYACGAVQSDFVTLTVPQPGTGGCTQLNTAPVATTNDDQGVLSGNPFSYTVNAFTDAETPGSLTYTASISPVSELTFNSVTRVISGTPTAVGSTSVTITARDPGGLSATTSFIIEVYRRLGSGGPGLTVSLTATPAILLTTGTASLSAAASGGSPQSPDHPYSYTFSGPGSITASGNTATVSGLPAGVQTFTVVAADANRTVTGTVSVTVSAPAQPTTLRVLSRDPDNGQLNNNTIKPYLLLQNAGTTPIPYPTITLRYWLTTENNIPLLFQKNYVAIGQNNLNLRYVALAQPRQGATGYIEYSFQPGAGSLAPMGDSGPLEVQVNKQNYSAFDQRDDYSYINNSGYTLNPRITAYQNGVIFYGQEPTGVSSARQGVVKSETFLSVRVLGNPVAGAAIDLEVWGAEGQPLRLQVIDQQGRAVSERWVETAGSVERQTLPVGNQPSGLLLLRVSTPSQSQTVKVLKVE